MGRNTFIFVILSGLCILSSCFPRRYHIVRDAKTWPEAKSYCNEKYTNLVTIDSKEEMIKLSHMLGDVEEEFWIGLYGDFHNWKWSLEREGFYKEGENEFRVWQPGQPNANVGAFICTNISPAGEWSDSWCSTVHPFICYSEFSETKYINVATQKNWTNAQKYCREHYTDLASVRNKSENDDITTLVEDFSWIGLYRESWKWSHGPRMRMTSFTNWNVNEPSRVVRYCATTTTQSKWNARSCNAKYAFVCSEDVVSKQVVRVMLTKSHPSVDLEEMQDAILQKFNQTLKEHSLGEKVKLKWRKRSDGKIFHLEETEEDK